MLGGLPDKIIGRISGGLLGGVSRKNLQSNTEEFIF